MAKKDYIPEPDSEFNSWQSNLFVYLNQHYASWNIPAAAISDASALRTLFEQKYSTASNPETRTQTAVRAKNDARRNYVKALRQLIKSFITYNPAVTAEDRSAMDLPIHKSTRTPVQIPETYPEFEIDTSVIRRLIIHFRDIGSRRKAKPAGVHSAYVRWTIASSLPATLDELTNYASDTRTPVTLHFEENQRGSTVYMCMCWENTRGERGPWSNIMKAIVP